MKKGLKAVILIASILFFSFCLGMSEAPVQSKPAEYQTSEASVEEAIANLEAAYESLNTASMMELLDRDFEGWLSFKSSIENQFLSSKSLQVHFVIDSYLRDKDKINVRLHWFKKTIDNAGTFTKSQGESQFAFRNTSHGLKLLYVRGDNPFF